MNQWLNRSHPQTLQAGVILGYFSAVFGLLQLGNLNFPPELAFLLYLGLGVGAFATANNKRWGYGLLAVCAALAALLRLWIVYRAFFPSNPILQALPFLDDVELILRAMVGSVFPVALAAAVLHVHSREYQKVWFE